MSDRLAYRNGKIGSSDAPIIVGVSPWMTPLQLWEEKLGIREPRSTSSWMQRGIDLEEKARCAFEEITGVVVMPQVLVHPSKEWMIASLDGLSIDGDIAVEIKCPGLEDHRFAVETGEPPRKYFPQLQHQLAVSGLDSIYYFSFRSASETVMIKVPRDDDYIQLLIEKEERFYECMQSYTPPDLTSRDFEIRNDDDWLRVASEWKACTAMMRELCDLEAMLREELILLSEQKCCSGGGVNLKKVVRKGGVDYKSIVQKYGIDVEDYRKSTSISWKLTCTEEESYENLDAEVGEI